MNTWQAAARLLLVLASGNALAAAAQTSPPIPSPQAIPPATLDDHLEVSGTDIAAQQVKSRLFISVGVNGQGPFRFLVDSGADRSVIGLELAQRLALPPGEPVRLQGMAGSSVVQTVRLERLRIGSSDIEDIVAPALDERYLGAQGLLGIDALVDQRLKLDFVAKTITVEDARKPAPYDPNEIVVTARRRKGQLILTEASVAGIRIAAVIDTGAEMTVGNSALRARLLGGRRPPAVRPVTLVSVTGQTLVADLVVLPNVAIGGVTLQGVTVAFADAPPFKLFGLDRQPAVLLGTDVLEAFRRVALDFRARKVRFVLRRG